MFLFSIHWKSKQNHWKIYIADFVYIQSIKFQWNKRFFLFGIKWLNKHRFIYTCCKDSFYRNLRSYCSLLREIYDVCCGQFRVNIFRTFFCWTNIISLILISGVVIYCLNTILFLCQNSIETFHVGPCYIRQ